MKQFLDNTDILVTVLCTFWYLWTAAGFCKRHLGASRKRELLFVIVSFSGVLLLNIGDRYCAVLHVPYMVLDHILFTGWVLLFFGESREKKILAAAVLMTVTTMVENFFESVLSCLLLIYLHTVNKVPEPLPGGAKFAVIADICMCMGILAVKGVSEHLTGLFQGKPGKWYAVLAIPLFVIIGVFDVALWGASNGIMVRSGGSMGLYYDQIFSHMEFAILAVLSMTAAGFYVFGMNRIYLEQEKSSLYHSQVAFYKMLTEQYRQSERLRHDMKNHMIALSALFRAREWEKMEDYLENMTQSGPGSDGDITGNRAVDALLYQKRKRAQEEKIGWECDVRLPGCCIREFDLCILFGNILDNALEACERLPDGESRFIHIQAKAVKKCFLLEVKNSMDRNERYTAGFTGKENPKEHGIGLLNVADMVRGYNGVVNIESGDGCFVISVLIPLNNAAG